MVIFVVCKEKRQVMKELSAKYNPSEVEDKWYSKWMEKKFFHSEPDEREPYTIVIPPPNVTGILHMGHVLNNTLNDVLIRKARMDGKNACWVPGTDHASIATESKVVARLKEQGISKEDLTREEFLRYAWEWKEEHGGIILKQLRKLGASCDWDRTRFTMDPDLSEAVISTFVHFYKKGTEKNLFQCYVKKENVQFVVGVRLKDFLKQGKNYTITPVEKTRNGEKKMVYIRVTCNHEDAAAVAETIIEAYESRTIKEVEPAAKTETKKDTKVKETKKSEKKDA